MRIKEGVSFVELHPGTRYAVLVVDEEVRRVTGAGEGVTITSFGESFKHSDTSLHYGTSFLGRKTREADDRCRAFDFEMDMFDQDEKDGVEKGVRRRLGVDFDLVLEATHWHLEYDPK